MSNPGKAMSVKERLKNISAKSGKSLNNLLHLYVMSGCYTGYRYQILRITLF